MTHEESDYAAILRQNGYRVTPQRLAVLDAVCDVGQHATFGKIYQRARELELNINQATVYRALDVLCEVGLVVSAEIGDEGKVYEISGSQPHHHLICRTCGKQYTLSNDLLQPMASAVYDRLGFKIECDHLVISGICQTCQSGEGHDGD